jgi:serine-type D-Ala-D-Ala carboxypeptidase/endopeptidase (penicillin-binding protein 4)
MPPRSTVSAALLVCASLMHAQANAQTETTEPELGTHIAALLSAPAAARAHWGIAVTRLDGTAVYSIHQDQYFRPASTAKLFTTAGAMALLGPRATTPTTLTMPAPDPDGTVAGDVQVLAHGDPDLSGVEQPWSATEPSAATPPQDPLHSVAQFVADLAARGVRHITGNIVVDGPWDPYPQGWAAEDLPWGYGAPVTAAAVNDNLVRILVHAGAEPGTPAEVTVVPDTGYFHLAAAVTTTAAGPMAVSVHYFPGDPSLRLTGTIAAGKTYQTTIAIDDPPLFIARALRQQLIAAGIAVDGEAIAPHEEQPDLPFLHTVRQPVSGPLHIAPLAAAPSAAGTLVVTHQSQTLADDLVGTLKESNNLHAELILQRLGPAVGAANTVDGARVLHQWLGQVGFSGEDVVLFDGSGLSTKDLVTPQAEAQLLAYAARQPWFGMWKAALPIGGVDGTLRNRFTEMPLKGRVLAKTGTLGESRALAGYVRCASGQELIIVVMVDNHEPGTSQDRAVMDHVVAAVAAAN